MSGTPPLFTRSFTLLLAGHFLQALGFSSLLLLPVYLAHLGASRGQIGTIMAVAAISGLLVRPAVAWALDAHGRRSTVVIGTLFLVTGMVLIGLVEDIGVLIYADRVLVGVGIAALFTGYFTWASDLIPVQRRTEGLAIFGISGLFPVGLNAFVDGMGVSAPALRYFFPLIGGLIALSLVALLFLREAPRAGQPPAVARPDARGDAASARGPSAYRPLDVVRALRQRHLVPCWLATFIFTGLVGLFMTYATVTATSRLGGEHAGWWDRPATLWLPYAVAAVSVRLFGRTLPDRIGTHNLVSPALASYLAAFLLIAAADEPREFLLAGLLAGLAHGYAFPVLLSQVVTRTPERWRGSAVAAYTALFGVSELLLIPLFGHIADRFSDATMYSAASVSALVCLTAWCALEHRWGGEP